MRVDVYVPLVLSALIGLTGPWVARRLPPAQGTWLLSVGAATAALGSATTLGLLALTLVGQVPGVAVLGHWTVPALRRADPVGRPIAWVALACVLVVGVLAGTALVRRLRALAEAYLTCHRLPASSTPLLVLADVGMNAYAVPGWPGRVVVSRELLATLPAEHRRVVIAHERAHLEHHHHWHATVVTVAAALNPMLAMLPAAVRLSTERWADECAAGSAGDRKVAAAALGRAALLIPPSARLPVGAMAATGASVVVRVRALLAEPVRSRPLLLLAAAGLLFVVALSAVGAAVDGHALFELAQATSV